MRQCRFHVLLAAVFALALLSVYCGSDRTTGTTDGNGADAISLELVSSVDGLVAEDVVVVGHHAYIADDDSVLVIVDIADVTHPVVLGKVGRIGNENGIAVAVAGDYAYVAVEADGVYIVDTSQPSSPATVGILGGYAKDVAVVGSYAYVADQDYGLRVSDVSDPAAPTLVGGCPSYGPFGIAVAGNYAYCADNDSGLCIMDISDPASPVIVGQYLDLESTRHVDVQGDYAFVDDWETGPVVLDISDPSAPTLKSRFQGSCEHLKVDGNYVYVSMGYAGGLAVVDVSNPTQPALVDSISTPTRTSGLDVDDDYVYVAAGEKFLIYSK